MSARHICLRGLVALAMVGTAATSARAQVPGGRCALKFSGTGSTRMNSMQVAGGRYHSFIGGGLTARCEGQDVTLQSDSAESYEETNLFILIGNVRYKEPRARLTSKRLTYYLSEERLLAEGDVVVTLPSGTVTRGPIVEYFRAVPAVRKESRMWAPLRSQSKLVQRDTTGKKASAADTVDVESDRMAAQNDSLVFLGGRVKITRTDMTSSSDSARLDAGTGFAQLIGGAVVRGKGEKPFTLESLVMDLFSKNKVLERVLAKGSARAVSDDMDVASDTILMDVDSSRVERARAWGKQRATVLSSGRRMIADSLDAIMPKQKVREVRLLRAAYAESDVDSTRIKSKERDWIRGDTLVATFDTAATKDTAGKARVKTIVATGSAKSYYQVQSSTGDRARPAINYVRGRLITVQFDTAGVKTVDVDEKAVGLYLEPAVDTIAAKAAKAAADKAAADSTANQKLPGKNGGKAPSKPVPAKPTSPAVVTPKPAVGATK